MKFAKIKRGQKIGMVIVLSIIAITFLSVLVFFIVSPSKRNMKKDFVNYLPKIGVLDTTTYAGHINVNNSTGSNLFYLFAEAKKVEPNTGVLLWLVTFLNSLLFLSPL